MRFSATLLALIIGTSLAAADNWTAGIPERLQQSLYPAVLDASWGHEGRVIWLFVADNGKSRDGLALAGCNSLAYYDEIPSGRSMVVRIYDVAQAAAGKSKVLGSADCEPK